jgi:hypothetical protein
MEAGVDNGRAVDSGPVERLHDVASWAADPCPVTQPPKKVNNVLYRLRNDLYST